jgi:hypothetical protein
MEISQRRVEMNAGSFDEKGPQDNKQKHFGSRESEGGGVSRRTALGTLGGIAATAVAFLEVGTPVFAGNGGAQLGSALHDRTAIGFVGQVEQDGETLTGYGYLTFVQGLETSKLFGDSGLESIGTARFTFYGTAMLVSRNVLGNVFSIDAEGDLDFFFQETGGADFEQPESFRGGTAIARDRLRLQDVLTVIAPNTGLPNVNGDLTRVEAGSFVLEGRRYRFGHQGLKTRLEATGSGTRLEIDPLSAVLQLAGTMTAIG